VSYALQEPDKMKKKTVLVLSGFFLIALLFVFLLKQPGGKYYTLKRTAVDYKILGSCTVSFPEPYEMVARAAGDIVRILVAEGQQARKGDLLIQVDDFKERQNLTIAMNNYENMKLKRVNAKEEIYPRLKEQRNEAGAALAEAQKNADRIGVLFHAGAISNVDNEEAKTKLESAQARFNQVQLQLDSYSRSGAAAELINQLNILNAQVELARRAVNDRRFIAPYDCTIVTLYVKPGETVAAGKKIATILEKKPWMLETNVDQKELGFLEAGLPCLVVFDAYPEEKIQGRVSQVAAVVDFAKGTCSLKLQITEDRPFIRHGMTGNVEISGKRIENVNVHVLALPVEYILREKSGNFVLVKTGRSSEKKTVVFNPIGEKWVSVRNLPEGTRIALPE
jgi:HlyD family secretion protein